MMLVAASAGDVATIRSMLEKNPERVRAYVCEHFV